MTITARPPIASTEAKLSAYAAAHPDGVLDLVPGPCGLVWQYTRLQAGLHPIVITAPAR